MIRSRMPGNDINTDLKSGLWRDAVEADQPCALANFAQVIGFSELRVSEGNGCSREHVRRSGRTW
jgi:hypothetical protein